MAGTLTIDTLKASSGVLATQNGMTGIAKAWVNFNGTTSPGTIRGSFNVSSVTRNGTGDYTINFATAMPNANYSPVFSGGDTTGSSNFSGSVAARVIQPAVLAAGSVGVYTGYQYTGGAALQDWGYVYASVFA